MCGNSGENRYPKRGTTLPRPGVLPYAVTMKGVVFTELLELVEAKYSLETVDAVLAKSGSTGVYTAVGTYPGEELARLLVALSAITETPMPLLLRSFGKHLFARFTSRYAHLFVGIPDCFEFMKKVDGFIHVEVRKLYPDADLPVLECAGAEDGRLIVIYRSPRRLPDLAQGLIEGCIDHFGEPISLARDDLSGGTGEVVRFTLASAAAQ